MKDIIFLLSVGLIIYLLTRIILKEPILPWKEKEGTSENQILIDQGSSLDDEGTAPLSKQVSYIVVGAILLCCYVPLIYTFCSIFNWLFGAIFGLVSLAITVAIFICLEFIDKRNSSRDYNTYIRLQRKTQYGTWRKGN
ncbi:hypothetical protein [Bacillus sp. NRRL B-14911]|uniref:hypothetical protein n=1 Tax=Bacillus sp. NRRL B-14911 TaxID=313627 RepID=UPI0005529ADD|nr:hypothetical protein [Bacillus sp. NRRL B-14911]